MEIYSRAVIGDIAVDLRYRFNGPGVIAYLRNLCPSMGFVCAACEGPLSVAVRLLPLVSVEYSLM